MRSAGVTTHYTAPESVIALAHQLRPLEQSLQESLWQVVPAPTPPALSRREVRQHFQGVRRFAMQVVWRLNRDLAPLVLVDTPDRRLHKAVTAISRLVAAQVARYQLVLSSHDSSGEGLNALLSEAYRHNLRELQRWMTDIINLADRPHAYVSPTSPNQVRLILEFTASPAMKALREQLMPIAFYGTDETQRTTPSLFLQIVWLLLGIGLINWLFGHEPDA